MTDEPITEPLSDEEYLATLPFEPTWLSDIVEVFLKSSNGINEIEGVLIALAKKNNRDLGKAGYATITRTINNYCVNSNDTKKHSNQRLFKRIAPSQYKLLTYPSRPDLVSIQNVTFSDQAYKDLWEIFNQILAKKSKWQAMSKRERLVYFAKQLQENEQAKKTLRVYQGKST